MDPSSPRVSRHSAFAALALIILQAGLFPLTSVADDPRAIPWRQDIQQARQEATRLNRLLWIQFTGPWCHYCQRMNQEVFTHSSVVEPATQSFVPIKLRADEHEELALNFGLSQLPATVILRPSGEIVALAQGYQDTPRFNAFLIDALKREGRTPPTARLNANNSTAEKRVTPLALEGHCPVTLVDNHKLIAGSPKLTIERNGTRFRFATETQRDAFSKNPDRYIPANSGHCPVAQVDHGQTQPGSPRWGVVYDGRLYLCNNDTQRKQFLKTPERYALVDVADQGFCPHCWQANKLLVRGRASHSLTRNGKRYFFPDHTHLEAFRDTDVTVRR